MDCQYIAHPGQERIAQQHHVHAGSINAGRFRTDQQGQQPGDDVTLSNPGDLTAQQPLALLPVLPPIVQHALPAQVEETSGQQQPQAAGNPCRQTNRQVSGHGSQSTQDSQHRQAGRHQQSHPPVQQEHFSHPEMSEAKAPAEFAGQEERHQATTIPRTGVSR